MRMVIIPTEGDNGRVLKTRVAASHIPGGHRARFRLWK